MLRPIPLFGLTICVAFSLLGFESVRGGDDIVVEKLMIPMRDGVRLSAGVVRPSGEGPWPVLLEQRYANALTPGVVNRYSNLARHGYVVVLANFRGAQESEGVWRGYRSLAWGERQDGYDLVEWLAVQPWSTGKIGSFGSSQAGFAQNFLAVTQPPHLVAQFMVDTGLSLFHIGYRIGGAHDPQRFQSLGRVARVPAHNDELLEEWTLHPTYDDYWADEDSSRHFDKMNLPCFTVGSWYDFMCTSSIESYIGRQHHGGSESRGRQKLLIGPWLHGGGKGQRTGELVYPDNAAFNIDAQMVRWFDHYLKGVDNGVEKEPNVRYYVMGAVGEAGAPGNVWRTASDWPVPAKATPYYLQPAGGLSLTAPLEETGELSYTVDVRDEERLSSGSFSGAQDARKFEAQDHVLTFTTDELTEPVEWTGNVVAEMFLASEAIDTDLTVRISDVYPDGRSMRLMEFHRRLRFRDGFEKEVWLTPGDVAPMAFDVGWVSLIFNRRHKIRVTVTSSGAPIHSSPRATSASATPEANGTATNRLQVNRTFPSRILAPVAP